MNFVGQFSHPCGVAYSKDKEVIAVTEQDNHRVQLFSLHGEPLKMFGSQGSEEGKFLYPHHLTFSVKFLCLVSDCVNDRIQVFDKDGEYQFCFGEEGKLWLYLRLLGLANTVVFFFLIAVFVL